MENPPKKRFTWITNLPAPYRIPIWDSIAEVNQLKVFFTLKADNYKKWVIPKDKQWEGRFLSRLSIRFGELDLVLNPFGFRKMIKGSDYVLVGGWEAPVYICSLLYTKVKSIPSYLFYESTEKSRRFNNALVNKLRYLVLNLSDFVITAGSASTEAVLKMGIKKEKIYELFNCSEVEFFNVNAQILRKKVLPGHHFLVVGQLIERKNIAAIIEAFAAIANPDDSLTIAGDGVLLGALERHIEDLKLLDRVKLVGHKNADELAFLYANCQTLVMASTNEVWGHAPTEALAAGCHSVVSDVAGVADFIQHMKGVYICKTNPESIAKAMGKSRNDYRFPILNPEIMSYTPRAFAEKLMQIIENPPREQRMQAEGEDYHSESSE